MRKQHSTWRRTRRMRMMQRLAHLAEVGFFREVRSRFRQHADAYARAARTKLVKITTNYRTKSRSYENIWLARSAGKGSTFEKNVRSLLADRRLALSSADAGVWRSVRIRAPNLASAYRGRRLASVPHPHVDPRRRHNHCDFFITPLRIRTISEVSLVGAC